MAINSIDSIVHFSVPVIRWLSKLVYKATCCNACVRNADNQDNRRGVTAFHAIYNRVLTIWLSLAPYIDMLSMWNPFFQCRSVNGKTMRFNSSVIQIQTRLNNPFVKLKSTLLSAICFNFYFLIVFVFQIEKRFQTAANMSRYVERFKWVKSMMKKLSQTQKEYYEWEAWKAV